jgi:caffeoyl-CoA O-methyltransferase
MMDEAEQYTESLFAGQEDPALSRVLTSIRENGMPDISVKPGYGRLLTLMVAASGAAEALEIGALGGYSGICLARGLKPGGSLVSLELKEEYASLAERNLTEAGYGGIVSYRVGEALDSLHALKAEGRMFDFVFIDADKGNYPNYLEWAITLGRPGALIVGDNTLMKGRVIDEGVTSPSVAAMRTFNERIAADPRLQGVMLPAYDGLAIARIL